MDGGNPERQRKKLLHDSKVKGHVTEQQVTDGIHPRHHKEGNDEADRLAAKGIEDMGDDAMQLGTYYARRQHDVLRITKVMQRFLIDIVKTAAAIREPDAKNAEDTNIPQGKPKAAKTKVNVAASLDYPPMPMCYRPKLLPLPRWKLKAARMNTK